MSRNWTDAQKAAMDIRDKTLLISAAAGSGKTATLTERIIRSLTDPDNPADISKMLIVTFTRAAADELKNRIFGALSDALSHALASEAEATEYEEQEQARALTRHLSEQMVKLGSARISTIDSFYLELLRANFSTLGIPASFRIVDPIECELLGREIMEDTVEYFYETDRSFPMLVECFSSVRNSDSISDSFLELVEACGSIPEGVDFLATSARLTTEEAELDFFETRFGKILRTRVLDVTEYCYVCFKRACEVLAEDLLLTEKLLASFEYDRDFCERLIDLLRMPDVKYVDVQALLKTFSSVRAKKMNEEEKTDVSESLRDLRDNLRDKINDFKKKTFSYSIEELRGLMLDTARLTSLLHTVLSEYQRRMSEEKKRRNMLDFTDIRRYTLRLLVDDCGNPTPIARRYADEFSHIYIDEYQDVDGVQDMIFSAIAKKNNRFMVGDIKQSIYGFRGAEPTLFAKYRELFPSYDSPQAQNSDCATIFMSENFRCDQNVILFTNLVCSRIFSACAESISYQPQDDLVFSKTPPTPDYQSPKVNVRVLLAESDDDASKNVKYGEQEYDEEWEDPEELSNMELEAEYIAREIERLIYTEKKADGSKICAGDIAVLFRSRTEISAALIRALDARGIQSSESDAERYFESADVLMLLCLLNTIDNPHRDIHLAGALRSLLFGFSMEDLVKIRTEAPASYSLYDALVSYKEKDDALAERCRSFDLFLTDMREKSTSLTVDRLLKLLFESDLFTASGLVTAQSSDGSGGNLLRMYEYARSFETGAYKGLYNFIQFINTVIDEDKKMKLPPKGSSPDRVNLMTMHLAKGLEFPVCFVCGTGKQFNIRDAYKSVLFEYPYGLTAKLADSTGFARIDNPMRQAMSTQMINRMIEEEMRVLYVAMTRARERLYVTGVSKKSQEELIDTMVLRDSIGGRYMLLRCRSYIDWVLLPFANPKSLPSCADLAFMTAQDVYKKVSVAPDGENNGAASVGVDEALRAHLLQKYAFQYPYAELRRLPAKLSVSRLSPDALDENDSSADLLANKKKAVVPDFFISDQPARVSAAERGTATHLFLQFCRFDKAKAHGIQEEIAYLTEKKFIPPNIANLIYTEELERFLKSDLLERIERSKRIIREQRFNVLLAPENFTIDNDFKKQVKGEQLAVQGVIDLVLIDEDGNPVLYDYKTDRLTRQELEDQALLSKRMNEAHGLQLSYYAHAASLLFGKPCKELYVYSTHAGRLVAIEPKKLILSEILLDTL